MSNKKITAFEYNDNPTLSDVFPIVNNGKTKQMTLSGLTNFIGTINTSLTGGTYDNNTGIAILNNSDGNSIELSGFTTNVKHWEENQNKILKSDETILISGDYVLVDSDLVLQRDTPITIGDLTFNKFSQIFIGGNLLLKDSNITNDGLINVAGAVILNGNSIITGTGIII
jgi:hypothetical protein